MKRLALHVLLCLLTFSAGVGIKRLLIGTTQTQPEVAPVATVDFDWPIENVLLRAPTPLPTPVPTSSPTQNLILDYDFERFDPSGYYAPIGKMPKGLREFEGFDSWLYEQADGKLTGEIYVPIESGGSYARIGLVTERRLYFATTIVSEDEIEYRFDGEFLRGKIVRDAPAGQAVLKGTLTKFKDGRKIAEAVVKFKIEIHGC